MASRSNELIEEQPLQLPVQKKSERMAVKKALDHLDVNPGFLRVSQAAAEKLQLLHKHISRGDHIKMIDGSPGPGHKLLGKLALAAQSLEPFTITVCRSNMSLHSLRQLQPPMKGLEHPDPGNSEFLLVTSTDGSIIRSIRGVERQSAGGAEVHHQVWASPHPAYERIMEAFKRKQHVFLIFVALGKVWGIARMMSPADRDSYGFHETWCWDAGDLRHWAWLGENFKIQWLKECLQPLKKFPSLRTGLPSDQGECKLSNGMELDTAKAWRDAEKLLRCPDDPHALRKPRWTLPPPSARRYLQYVKGKDYNSRENVNHKLTDEKSKLQDATKKK